jgi:L-amino acid N-acyltransferase YncA
MPSSETSLIACTYRSDEMRTSLALSVRQATSEQDFEAVRLIRNAGREWMADMHEISVEEQAKFRLGAHSPVYVYEINGVIVGWGWVKRGPDRYAYVTLAVRSDMRGKGIGRDIYKDLRTRWQEDDEVWAVIRNGNIASLRAALAAGYTLTSRVVSTGTVALRARVLT